MEYEEILQRLEKLADPKNIEGMKRFGITPKKTFGISMPELRATAKKIGTNHQLALKLWDYNSRETRILASMAEDPALVTEKQMDSWAEEFDYWEICDQCCMNLFWKTPHAWKKAVEWSSRKEEYVKRAGFALMAVLAWKEKKVKDTDFEKLLVLIKRESSDERPIVRKAVNWALRQIGKRNPALNKKAIEVAKKIQKMDSKAARWIASDALRELTGDAVRKRLKGK